MKLPGKEIKQCHSLPVGHEMSWISQLMRLAGREIKQCHSLPVGHGMRHD